MGRAVLTSSSDGLNRQFSNKFRSKFERRRIPKIVLNFERTEYRRAGRRYSKLSILISKELVGERGSWCSFDCWNCTDSISWMDKVARSRRWVTFGGTIPRPDSHNWTNFAEEQASSKRPSSTHGSLHLGTNFEPLFLRVLTDCLELRVESNFGDNLSEKKRSGWRKRGKENARRESEMYNIKGGLNFGSSSRSD